MFQVRSEQRPTPDRDGAVVILESLDGVARAEIWPGLGFNCYRWRHQGAELLYADPQLFTNGRPTRSGIPVLFPFPNRIRAGHFQWRGRDYQLPLNDPTMRNAIHGFVCQRPWRISRQGTDAESAWVEGEFLGSRDAADASDLWPADYRLRLCYRLTRSGLRIETTVDNPDRVPLPFGLGYHPYFRLGASSSAESWVQVKASAHWELQENLPTGTRLPIDAARDLRAARLVAGLSLDDILTGLDESETTADGLVLRGCLGWTEGVPALRLWTAPAFRELVVFTPPHRQAVCLEPYTCLTDAINLAQQGIDKGWRVLEPGQSWSATVLLQP